MTRFLQRMLHPGLSRVISTDLVGSVPEPSSAGYPASVLRLAPERQGEAWTELSSPSSREARTVAFRLDFEGRAVGEETAAAAAILVAGGVVGGVLGR